jgi:DNA-binding response OmpR family regulator
MSDTRRVLVIEGDRFLRRACEASLRQRGLGVVAATDGEEGIRAAMREPFDVILLDLIVPKKSGTEVLAAIRADEALKKVPVFILANSSRDEDRRRALALGANGYYVKANLSLRALVDDIALLTGTESS